MSNISTALAIQEACREEVYNPEAMYYAAKIVATAGFTEEIAELLLKYAATLSAGVATKVVSITMSRDEFSSMVSELKEMESIHG